MRFAHSPNRPTTVNSNYHLTCRNHPTMISHFFTRETAAEIGDRAFADFVEEFWEPRDAAIAGAAVLGIDPVDVLLDNITICDVNRRWRLAALDAHPDRFSGQGQATHERMATLNASKGDLVAWLEDVARRERQAAFEGLRLRWEAARREAAVIAQRQAEIAQQDVERLREAEEAGKENIAVVVGFVLVVADCSCPDHIAFFFFSLHISMETISFKNEMCAVNEMPVVLLDDKLRDLLRWSGPRRMVPAPPATIEQTNAHSGNEARQQKVKRTSGRKRSVGSVSAAYRSERSVGS